MSNRETDPRASSVRPLLEGDMVDDRRVNGFAWRAPAPGQRSNHHDDRLLLDGDELLDAPPDRRVPQSAEAAVPIAPMPPADLPPERAISSGFVDATVANRVAGLINLPGAVWQPFIRPLLAAVHASGHKAWLAGGAVRDVLSGVPAEKVNDLDMSGTVPTGRFVDMAYQALRATGRSEYPVRVSPSNLICYVSVPGLNTRLIEYRGLSRSGFPYPVVGSRLAEDARHRDFAFNSLLYDVLDETVLDPSGHGTGDLLNGVRRFRPLTGTTDPFELAEVVVRAMKFALRWADEARLDLEPLHRWLASMPDDLWASLTEMNRESLRKARAKIPAPPDAQRRFAATLPEPGRSLLESLIGGA